MSTEHGDYQEQLRRPPPTPVALWQFFLYGWWYYPMRDVMRYYTTRPW